MTSKNPDHFHTKNDGSWWEYDADGIPLCRVCDICRAEKMARYRPDIQTRSSRHYGETVDEQ